MDDDGRVGRIQAAARIGAALTQGPLTLYAACLVADGLTDDDWQALTKKERADLRSRVMGILDCIESVAGRLLAEDTQGRTTIYFLITEY